MIKVAIVEDDKVIAQELCQCLREWNFAAELLSTEGDVLAGMLGSDADILLLDVHLPKDNGIVLCRKFRQQKDTPVLFISSDDNAMKMITAYEYGGDDYIVKPFDKMVLIAKLNAFLRRRSKEHDSDLLRWEQLTLQLRTCMLHYQKKEIELTRNELRIMELLMSNPGVILSRSDMMMALWNSDCYIDDNTLSVNVGRLRKKLLDVFGLEDVIKTKKGMGYYL